METLKEIVVEILAIAIGWSFNMALLIVMFGIGHSAAGLLNPPWDEAAYKVAAGLLSAMAFLWLYEGRKAREQFDALWNRQRDIANKIDA